MPAEADNAPMMKEAPTSLSPEEADDVRQKLRRRFELTDDMIIQELGWDDDCGTAVSEIVEDLIGSELVDESSYEVCDAVLYWWRDGDGDLVDDLVDAVSPLDDNGFILLLTPKTGRPGAVDPALIAEGAHTAGLTQTATDTLGEWQGNRLVQQRGTRK